MGDNDRLVYSTGPDGKVNCPNCGKTPCACPEGLAGELRKRTQTEPVRVSFRRTGKGSGLTLVERLPMHPAGKEELLRKFKKRLGVGGTVKDGVLEIQGDRRAFVKAELEAAGWLPRLPIEDLVYFDQWGRRDERQPLLTHLMRDQAAAQAAQPGQPSAEPPVERERFGKDTATHNVRWQSTLFGWVTIGIDTHCFGREIHLDQFTMVVPIELTGQPDAITFFIERGLTPGIRMFRSQMNAPADCTEGDMASATFPINWIADSQGGQMPSTVKGRRDMDLIFLDTTGVGDGRKGAMVVLEVSITTRHGQLWLGFQRVYAGQVVRTTAEKAQSMGFATVEADHHRVAVVPLMPENAYPKSSFFGNFSHLAVGIVTAAINLEASVPLSSCVVARWQPSAKELPAELSHREGWFGANICWFNATIGCGVVYLDDGRSAFVHFKQIEGADGAPLWKQPGVFPMLTPMTRVAVRVVQESGTNLKATAVRPF